MPNTTNFSLPYPQSSDTPDVPRDMLALANAVDTKLLQTVRVFLTTTDRDAAITSPTAGMVCYVDSGDATEGLYTYQGAAWRMGPGWNAPWGLISVTKNTTTDAAITTDKTTITSPSFTAIANRNYRITYIEHSVSNSNAEGNNARIRISGPNTIQVEALFGGIGQAFVLTNIVTLSAGSTVLVATLGRQAGGTGTTTATRSATSPAQLVIEDIGPAGAPA